MIEWETPPIHQFGTDPSDKVKKALDAVGCLKKVFGRFFSPQLSMRTDLLFIKFETYA